MFEVMKYVLCNAVVHHRNHQSTANVDSFHIFLWKTLWHDSLDLQTSSIFATQKYVHFSKWHLLISITVIYLDKRSTLQLKLPLIYLITLQLCCNRYWNKTITEINYLNSGLDVCHYKNQLATTIWNIINIEILFFK